MKSYWKQFAEWVIALRDNYFVRTRIVLTVLFTISVIIIILLFLPFTQRIQKSVIESTLQEHLPGKEEAFYKRLTNDISRNLAQGRHAAIQWTLFLIMTATANYYLTGRGLRPIQESVEAQKRFIADSSHELRTPLSIIKTNSEIALLEGEDLSSEEAITTLKSNLEEIDR